MFWNLGQNFWAILTHTIGIPHQNLPNLSKYQSCSRHLDTKRSIALFRLAPAHAMGESDVLLAEMGKADPDLDPVWGLLLGAAPAEAPPPAAVEVEAVRAPEEEMTEGALPAVLLEEDEEVEKECLEGKSISNVVDKAEVLPDMFPLPEELPEGTSVSCLVLRNSGDFFWCSVFLFWGLMRGLFFFLKVSFWQIQGCHEIPGCDAFVLDDVLTEDECQSLIDQAEGLWTLDLRGVVYT